MKFIKGDLLIIPEALEDRKCWDIYVCHLLYKKNHISQHNKGGVNIWEPQFNLVNWLILYTDIFQEPIKFKNK